MLPNATSSCRRRTGPTPRICSSSEVTVRAERRLRDLASMARGGFAYDLAKKVIDAASVDALDEG